MRIVSSKKRLDVPYEYVALEVTKRSARPCDPKFDTYVLRAWCGNCWLDLAEYKTEVVASDVLENVARHAASGAKMVCIEDL